MENQTELPYLNPDQTAAWVSSLYEQVIVFMTEKYGISEDEAKRKLRESANKHYELIKSKKILSR